jgi:RNA polymerase sigma-70 factor (ECF subfamily)
VTDKLESLFRVEYPRLVRALTLASGDGDRATDAVQDAFVQASRHWRRIRHYDEPAAWLRRVAVNRMTDQGRRQQRRDGGMIRLVNQSQVEDHARVDETDRAAAVVDLRRALATLPEGQRMVVCLHYLADLSVAQVAAALGIAPGTVKSQLHDARHQLFCLLEDDDDDG